MDWTKICSCLLEAVISIAIPLLFALLRTKIKNETALKLINQAETVAINCVMLIEQTYVIPLKERGQWDSTSQLVAYEDCKKQLLAMLTEEMIAAITTVYADVDEWCKT